VGGDRVPDGLHGLDRTVLEIVRVDRVLVVQAVHRVQLLGRQEPLGRVLDEEAPALVLGEAPGGHRIAVVSEDPEGLAEGFAARDAILVRWHDDVAFGNLVGCVAYPRDGLPIRAVAHALRDLQVAEL
jgi:hypothetical protein